MIRKVTPERLDTRERYRHDHDQNATHNQHGQEISYRAQAEIEHTLQNRPKAEHSTYGEAQNLRGTIEDDQFAEYPRYGKSFNRGAQARKSFEGVGPKGYKRPDERIEEEVCAVLAQDPYIDARELIVSVKDGLVTLSGTVTDREDRFASEMLVETILGVSDIINNIKVKKQIN